MSEPSDLPLYSQAMALAAQGRLAAALSLLSAASPEQLDDAQRASAQAMLARFGSGTDRLPGGGPEGLDPWAMAVLTTYRRYWREVLLGLAPAAAGEATLRRELTPLAGIKDPGDAPAEGLFADIEAALAERFRALGLYTLFGRTAPLREFMLWREQQVSRHRVPLVSGPQEVEVVNLDGFISLGWLGFATAEALHTGGWAADGRLFCVAPAYRGKPEVFRVSFLTHEAQHLVDLRAQAPLDQAALEYRAKLAELSVAEATLPALLAKFDANRSTSRETPHAHANDRVMHDLGEALRRQGLLPERGATPDWSALPAEAVRRAAAELLGRDHRH